MTYIFFGFLYTMGFFEAWDNLSKPKKALILVFLALFVIIAILLVIFLIIKFTGSTGTTGSNGTTLYVGDGSGQCQAVNSNNGIPWTLTKSGENDDVKVFLDGIWGNNSDDCTKLNNRNFASIAKLEGSETIISYDPSNAATNPPIFPGQYLKITTRLGEGNRSTQQYVPSTATRLTIYGTSTGNYEFSWN